MMHSKRTSCAPNPPQNSPNPPASVFHAHPNFPSQTAQQHFSSTKESWRHESFLSSTTFARNITLMGPRGTNELSMRNQESNAGAAAPQKRNGPQLCLPSTCARVNRCSLPGCRPTLTKPHVSGIQQPRAQVTRQPALGATLKLCIALCPPRPVRGYRNRRRRPQISATCRPSS